MWNLNLTRIAPFTKNGLGNVAIETGTCRGNGTRLLAKQFSRVITIELSASLCRAARERLAAPEFSHVEFVNGNSAEELKRILEPMKPSPVFFFLDAHWSGDHSVDWEKSDWKGYGLDTAHLAAPGSRAPNGPEQCPLIGELEAITEFCSGPAYILIDDMKNIPAHGPGLKDVGFPGEDWSHLSRELLLRIVGPRLDRAEILENPEQLFLALNPR